MRFSIFLGLAGLTTLALARVPLNERSENVDIYARDAEPDYGDYGYGLSERDAEPDYADYGYDLSERDEEDFFAQLHARDLDYDVFEREADPDEDDESLGLFVRDSTVQLPSNARRNPPKYTPNNNGLAPFYLPARPNAAPVKYTIVNGKAVRQRRSVYDDYYGY
ncbi:hypothetical protein MMC17_006429 [Xylographa soralifera]|nr:hypothetical protein [Xylographa soralifera]